MQTPDPCNDFATTSLRFGQTDPVAPAIAVTGGTALRPGGLIGIETRRTGIGHATYKLRPARVTEAIYPSHYVAGGHSELAGRFDCRRDHLTDRMSIDTQGNVGWHGRFNGRTYDFATALDEADFNPGPYDITVEVSAEAAEFACAGEQEHLDDFHIAFEITYERIVKVLKQCSESATSEQKLIKGFVDTLEFWEPHLVPAAFRNAPQWHITKPAAGLAQDLETHWRRCFHTLCGLSAIRDINNSHSGASYEVHVNQAYRAAVGAAVQRQGARAARANDPFAGGGGVNPLFREAPAQAQPERIGKLNMRAEPNGTALQGASKRLISFKNPYYQQAFQRPMLDVNAGMAGIANYQW